MKTVLFIEEDILIRELVFDILAKGGFKVIEAGSEEDAAAKLENESTNLIVAHVEPHYEEIIDILKRVRQSGRYPCIPILAYSSQPAMCAVLNREEIYDCYCIQMPFSSRYLMSAAFMCMNLSGGPLNQQEHTFRKEEDFI